MIIWCNQDIESHRDWLANFGTTADDVVKDNKIDTFVSNKNYPTVEVTIPEKIPLDAVNCPVRSAVPDILIFFKSVSSKRFNLPRTSTFSLN